MARRSLPRAHAIALVALAALAALPGLAAADHSWDGLHWARQENPFVLRLADNTGRGWRRHLAVAAADWSRAEALDAAVVAGEASRGTCRPTLGRVEVCAGRYGDNGWLGIAQVWVSGRHITQARVKLNGTYFAQRPYNTPAWRQFVVCQEVGHAFGLDHQDEGYLPPNRGTCMDYTDDPDGPLDDEGPFNNEHPNQHDYDETEAIYAHGDRRSTVGKGRRFAVADPAVPPLFVGGAWLRDDLYLQELADGTSLLTWVTWAGR